MTDFVKPITCSRCKGKGYVNSHVSYAGAPGGCFKCAGLGVVEGDRATIAAAKVRQERFVAASKIVHSGDLGYGDLTDADVAVRREAREFRNRVVVGWRALEEADPVRHAKAVDSVLAGHPKVFTALAAYVTG